MKNYLKLGILLLVIPLLLLNCEKEEIIPQGQMKFKTVSKEIAKELLINYIEEQKKVLKKGNDAFSFKPLWETLEQEELSFTDALLTNLKIESNIELLNTTRLFFIEANGKIVKAIETKIISEKYIDGKQKKGFVFYHDFEGKFITAYKIEKGKTTLRYEKKNIQQASFFSFFQSCNGDLSLEDLIQLAEANGGTWVVLDGCDLGTIATSQEEAVRKYASDIDGFLDGSSNYSSTGEGGGGSSTPPNTDPITGECKEGYVKNQFGECVKPEDACIGGKVYNETTKKCECPEGKVEDSSGNCVEKPCKGNPIKGNLEIAPQKNSGTKGALQGCTRYGGSCNGIDGRSKFHAGIDIKSEYGTPIHAMYDGFIYSTKNDPTGAGYYTRIQSTVNGKTFIHEYFHLQKENRVLQGNPLVKVKAGDIIGYQGDSGNLKSAIAGGGVDSHVHIEIREHDGSSKWGYDNFNLVDPREYFTTKINDDGTSEINTNCN